MSKISKFAENNLGTILGIILAVVYIIFPNILDINNFKKEVITIGFLIFGFLITLLGIIIQSNNPNINRLKKQYVLYNRFTIYIQKCIYISASSAIYAILLSYLKLPFPSWILPCSTYVVLFLNSILIFFIVKLFIDTYMFLKIFFIVFAAKKPHDENENNLK